MDTGWEPVKGRRDRVRLVTIYKIYMYNTLLPMCLQSIVSNIKKLVSGFSTRISLNY